MPTARGVLTRAVFSNLTIGVAMAAQTAQLDPDMPAGDNLLSNGSFEDAGESGDVAADWNRWGALDKS